MKLVIALTQLTSRTPPVFGGFFRHTIPGRRGQVHLFARKTSGPLDERFFYEEGDIEAFNRDMARLNQDSRYTPYGLLAIAIAEPQPEQSSEQPKPEPEPEQQPGIQHEPLSEGLPTDTVPPLTTDEQPAEEQPDPEQPAAGELPDDESAPDPVKPRRGRPPGKKK